MRIKVFCIHNTFTLSYGIETVKFEPKLSNAF